MTFPSRSSLPTAMTTLTMAASITSIVDWMLSTLTLTLSLLCEGLLRQTKLATYRNTVDASAEGFALKVLHK